jgi:biopolymer transport protein TolR
MASGSGYGNCNGGDSEEFAPLADINVTPFIDVMLVLLVIFMVTAPMLATGMKVDLPKSAVATPLENQKPVVVTLGEGGAIQVGARIVAREALATEVRAEMGGAERVIQLRAGQETPYGQVVAVLDLLASAGMNKIALVADRARGAASADPAPPPAASADNPYTGHVHH